MSRSSPARNRLALVIVLLALVAAGRPLRAEEAAPPKVNVILWFDTEDYLLPADDDAAKRLAEMLSKRGIRATFKVVGEKARVLEKRGRTDVIEALRKHEIGFHSNFHSVHPTPTEYLADCGLLDGMQEFVRREKPGAVDVCRIFNVPTLVCYGQPGSSWAPQAIAALGECGVSVSGIPCYLDSGSHVGMDGKPFWYEGALNVYHMGPNETRMDLFKPDALSPAEKKFASIADRLATEGGGLISIFYHPCEWVHVSFWDGENFGRGANPPREKWKPPGQRPAEETEAAFERFGAYLDYIRSYQGVHFVTAADLPALYPDALRSEGASEAEVLAIARTILSPEFKGLDDQVIGRKAFSPADQFVLLTSAVTRLIDETNRSTGAAVTGPFPAIPGLLGPDGPPPPAAPGPREPLRWTAFRDAALDVRGFLQADRRIPARVFIGADAIPPADFVPALAAAYAAHRDTGRFPEQITLGSGVELLTAKRVAADTPGLFGGWVIHRANFRAPKLMDLARLQAWTLKPAMRCP